MTQEKTENKHSTNMEIPKNEKINFPVTFNLKAVIDSSTSDEENITNLSSIIDDLKIKNLYIGNKKSSKGTYVSYNYKVTLQSKMQLEKLYTNLKSIPNLKFAL